MWFFLQLRILDEQNQRILRCQTWFFQIQNENVYFSLRIWLPVCNHFSLETKRKSKRWFSMEIFFFSMWRILFSTRKIINSRGIFHESVEKCFRLGYLGKKDFLKEKLKFVDIYFRGCYTNMRFNLYLLVVCLPNATLLVAACKLQWPAMLQLGIEKLSFASW